MKVFHFDLPFKVGGVRRQEKNIGGDHLSILPHRHSMNTNNPLIPQFIPDLLCSSIVRIPASEDSSGRVQRLIDKNSHWSLDTFDSLQFTKELLPVSFSYIPQNRAIPQSLNTFQGSSNRLETPLVRPQEIPSGSSYKNSCKNREKLSLVFGHF